MHERSPFADRRGPKLEESADTTIIKTCVGAYELPMGELVATAECGQLFV
jgi:hypothetical protein